MSPAGLAFQLAADTVLLFRCELQAFPGKQAHHENSYHSVLGASRVDHEPSQGHAAGVHDVHGALPAKSSRADISAKLVSSATAREMATG